jgi:hypothetical protein
MNARARAAAVAGSFASAAAVVVAIILPVHHATPASAAAAGLSAGSAVAVRGSGGPGAGTGTSQGGTPAGRQGSAGPGNGSGAGGSGSGSGGSGAGSGGTGPIQPVGGLPHTTIPVVTAIPSPTGTIGDPGVPCLQGYVWRQAYGGDYVCVSPVTRSQAAADNAAALKRVQPGGGAYGQYTCLQGYVWRQVVPDDYICVTPAVRAQAGADNAQAGNRVALLSLWVSDWTPPSPPPAQNCSGSVCTTTDGGSDLPQFQINGDHFNFGPVVLEVRNTSGSVLWQTTVTASSYPGFPGGALYAQTPFADCASVPGTSDNLYVIAFDTLSGQWSAKLPVNSDCASL